MTPQPLPTLLTNLHNAAAAAGRPDPVLLAVSKTQPAEAVQALAAQGQRAFGENYVQEAVAKIEALASLGLEWVQSVARLKLVTALAAHRPAGQPPLNVLIQVNIDDEDSKHGCAPEDIDALATAIAAAPQLRLRGLMAIPAPWPDAERRQAAFTRMATLFAKLAAAHPQVDTLSMGMSSDYPEAIAHGATLVRVGTALFGARPRPA